MNNDQFDNFTRRLGTAVSRRDVLKLLFAGLGGSLLARYQGQTGSLLSAKAEGTSCAKQTYTNTNFQGFQRKPIIADVQFFDSLDQINQCAIDHNVMVIVTDSYDPTPGGATSGGFQKRAANSDHKAGHAIDMNVDYHDTSGNLQRCMSGCLRSNQPPPVTDFINCVKQEGLRWGGDFRDPVHFDDNLYRSDPTHAAWQDRVDAMRNSASCPTGEICVNGICVASCPDCTLYNTTTQTCEPVDCGSPCLVCVSNSCQPKSCPDCTSCNAETGNCDAIDCGDPCLECVSNSCQAKICPDCTTCNSTTGTCDPVDCGDPCLECVNNSCQPIQCGECEKCQNGTCVPCSSNQYCCSGSCQDTPCSQCPPPSVACGIGCCATEAQCCGTGRPEGPGCCPTGMVCADQSTGLCKFP